MSAKSYEAFPNMIIFNVSYVNSGIENIRVNAWVNHAYSLKAQDDDPGFWSFQGSSSTDRADWVQALAPGFYQENYMGMNQSDYGGGIPVTDLWREDGGVAVGHLEMVPMEVSLPVDFDPYSQHADVGIKEQFK